MKRKNMKRQAVTAFLALCGSALLANEMPSNNANPAYFPSMVQAQLRLNIREGAEMVHFIRDTNDPKIITKTYLLKHADAYAIRPYLREMVQALRVNYKDGDDPNQPHNYYNIYRTKSGIAVPAGVECIKFADGVGAVIISAEEYRFKDSPNGMGIDSIVAHLDKPGMRNSSGQPKFIYFPANRPASELNTMIKNVGANMSDDTVELIGGKDKVAVDKGLNCLFFNTALYSRKNIEDMLKLYDVPHPEVRVKYMIYEIYAENDGRLGADFQAWKNNDGADFFSTGARYRDNWSATFGGGLQRGAGSSNSQYFNFNPKWNTRYLDFLVSRGKGKVAYTGELFIRNNKKGSLVRNTGIVYARQGDQINPAFTMQLGNNYDENGAVTPVTDMVDMGGTTVTVVPANAVIGAAKTADANGDVRVTLTAHNGARFYKNGQECGKKVVVSDSVKGITWGKDETVLSDSGFKIEEGISNGYQFKMDVTPSVTANATILDVSIKSNTLMGYLSDGTPRQSQLEPLTTRIMIGNKNNRFVIGGIEKLDVVRGQGGIPILKDIPLIGWAFSTESESTKKSQLVVVAECESVRPDSAVPENINSDIQVIRDAVKGAGNHNSYGYGQWGFDSGKKLDLNTY